MGRDLVNTPANDMGPEALADAALELAARHGAKSRVVVGEALLAENFPLIHAVGRASAQAPRLVDFVHGPEDALKVTLVGKGVCFDTGGLDIKPSSGMLLMKKDMGGAAVALSLASMLLEGEVPVRLRVILPIVENSLSASAYRPGDVYRSRKGLSVEIGNTDAEGRLVLADALALACEDQPDLLFDFATLTGAARVALGPELPPFYTGCDALAQEIAKHARGGRRSRVAACRCGTAYDSGLDGKISDVVNVTSNGMAGSITAALFLRRFVADPERWAHFDVYCWNAAAKPGRPGRRRHPGRAAALRSDRGARRREERVVSESFDRRLTPARPDLAAKYLEGRVEAARFVEGVVMQVKEGVVDVKREPRPDAGLDTQALYGESSPSTTKRKAGPGDSSRATNMSAGSPPIRCGASSTRRRIA